MRDHLTPDRVQCTLLYQCQSIDGHYCTLPQVSCAVELNINSDTGHLVLWRALIVVLFQRCVFLLGADEGGDCLSAEKVTVKLSDRKQRLDRGG